MAGLIMLRARAMDLTKQNSQALRLWEAAPRSTPAGGAQQAEQGGVTLRCHKASALINRKWFPLFWHAKCWQWYFASLWQKASQKQIRDETMYSRSVSEGSVHHGGEGMALEGCAKGCLRRGRPLLKEEARRAQSLKYSTSSSFPLSVFLRHLKPVPPHWETRV